MVILGHIIVSFLILGYGTVADYPMCGTITRSVWLTHTYTVYFQTCYSPNPDPTKVCCYPGTQAISSAWLENDTHHPQGLNLHHNNSYFWINTSQLNLHPGGRYLFQFMYFYNCFTNLCEHPQHNITLELRVAGLQLNVKAKVALANHIGLRCSSHSNSSKDVKFRFKYTPRTGKNVTAASCLANQNRIIRYNEEYWLVYRMKEAPYDCILAIQNISYDYSGVYECVGFFPVDGRIDKVSSNHVGLAEEETMLPPLNIKPSGKDIYIYLTILIIITLVLLLLVTTYIWNKCKSPRRPMPIGIGCTDALNANAELVYGAMGTTNHRIAQDQVGQGVIGGAAALLANPVGHANAIHSGTYERLDGPRVQHDDSPRFNQEQGVTQGTSGSSSGSYEELDSSRAQDHVSGEPSAN